MNIKNGSIQKLNYLISEANDFDSISQLEFYLP